MFLIKRIVLTIKANFLQRTRVFRVFFHFVSKRYTLLRKMTHIISICNSISHENPSKKSTPSLWKFQSQACWKRTGKKPQNVIRNFIQHSYGSPSLISKNKILWEKGRGFQSSVEQGAVYIHIISFSFSTTFYLLFAREVSSFRKMHSQRLKNRGVRIPFVF